MDPLTLAVVVTQLIAVATNTALLLKRIRGVAETESDPAFKALQAKLFTEHTRLSLWKNYVDGEPGGLDAVLETLSRDQKSAIVQFLNDAESLLKDANRRFERANPNNRKGKLEKMKASVLWGLMSQDDLKVLVDAVNSINTALEKVVMPPPRYHSFGHRPPRTATTRPSSPGDEEAEAEDQPPPFEVLGGPRGAATRAANLRSRPRVIQHLHRHGLLALKSVESFDQRSRSFDHPISSLQMLDDMLHGPLAIDLILDQVDESAAEEQQEGREGEQPQKSARVYDELRSAFVTILADIILIGESILTELVKETPDRADLSRALVDTIASFALEDPADVELVASRPMPLTDFESVGDLLSKGQAELTSAVTDLYQLLPMIRMLRRGKILDWQEKEARENAAAVSTQAQNEVEADEAASTRGLLDDVLEMVSPAQPEKNDEQEGESVQASVSRVSEKEIELLREYRLAHLPRLQPADREAANALFRVFLNGGKTPTSKGVASGSKGMSEKQWEYVKSNFSELVDGLPRVF